MSAFVPCPAVLDFQLPHPTYIHSLPHNLEFTLSQLPIVLLQYCPVISVVHIASKALLPLTLHTFITCLIADNSLLRLPSTHFYTTFTSSKQTYHSIYQYLRIASAILRNATLIPDFGPGGPQPRMRPWSSDAPTTT